MLRGSKSDRVVSLIFWWPIGSFFGSAKIIKDNLSQKECANLCSVCSQHAQFPKVTANGISPNKQKWQLVKKSQVFTAALHQHLRNYYLKQVAAAVKQHFMLCGPKYVERCEFRRGLKPGGTTDHCYQIGFGPAKHVAGSGVSDFMFAIFMPHSKGGLYLVFPLRI